ncbi:MAG: DUF262 domain-containing protein [Porphyromonadaceae bacterium]|nr:DUF262 domain-containing protein [Porphyromonadaceae bacterium]
MSKAEIRSVEELLGRELQIPPYQRPYKWTKKNITDLLLDIETSIREAKKYKDFKYRVGTVILHANTEEEKPTYDIVDGQQRILSFLLLSLYLDYLECGVGSSLSKHKFSSKVTQKNLHENYKAIWEWFAFAPAGLHEDFKQAMKKHLEVVVITVDEISEAFQLFDSQNSRGRALYPHDLLKAYHLRVISGKRGEERAVEEWEAKDPKAIAELFRDYLFPIWHWARRRKCGGFTTADIDLYKGVEPDSKYAYAYRVRRTGARYQITEPFPAGRDFFKMVHHYMQMLKGLKREVAVNPALQEVKDILIASSGRDKKNTLITSAEELDEALDRQPVGFRHACRLFFCALLCYYDRFGVLDARAVKRLFTWAMMLRVNMQHLGFASINKYAIGERDPQKDQYTNVIPVLSMIVSARKHTEISDISLKVDVEPGQSDEKWERLRKGLRALNQCDATTIE